MKRIEFPTEKFNLFRRYMIVRNKSAVNNVLYKELWIQHMFFSGGKTHINKRREWWTNKWTSHRLLSISIHQSSVRWSVCVVTSLCRFVGHTANFLHQLLRPICFHMWVNLVSIRPFCEILYCLLFSILFSYIFYVWSAKKTRLTTEMPVIWKRVIKYFF